MNVLAPSSILGTLGEGLTAGLIRKCRDFFFKFPTVPYNLIGLIRPNHFKAIGYQHLVDITEAVVVLFSFI
jgi:hypothetical protein